MNDTDIPILKKTYDLYKIFDEYRKVIPQRHRFTLYSRCEDILLDVMQIFYEAGYMKGTARLELLNKASVKLNMVRVFVRLLKDTRCIDEKKYLVLQTNIDEIGRMLGGWIRSIPR